MDSEEGVGETERRGVEGRRGNRGGEFEEGRWYKGIGVLERLEGLVWRWAECSFLDEYLGDLEFCWDRKVCSR